MDEREKNTLIQDILKLCNPVQVILYGAKRGISSGQLKTVNLCIVVPMCNKNELLQRLYLQMPLEIQVNLKVYTVDEWQELQSDPNSYAAWIAQKGTVLYET